MESQSHNTVMQAQIRKAIDVRMQAIRHKDIDTAIQLYHEDVVSFDVVGALLFKGNQLVKDRLVAWLGGFKQDVIGFDITDIHISSAADIAYCYSLNHVHAAMHDGNLLDMWWRETTCYKRFDGIWLIVHAHNSVPFDMETGRPSLDLKP